MDLLFQLTLIFEQILKIPGPLFDIAHFEWQLICHSESKNVMPLMLCESKVNKLSTAQQPEFCYGQDSLSYITFYFLNGQLTLLKT